MVLCLDNLPNITDILDGLGLSHREVALKKKGLNDIESMLFHFEHSHI